MASHINQILMQALEGRRDEVAEWFADAFEETPAFFYNSVDVRHSGSKLAPVDTNLFPAGFNNLAPMSRERSITAIQEVVESGSKILIIPEEHTRNLKYLDSLVALRGLLEAAGAEVAIATIDPEAEAPLELQSASGEGLIEFPLRREGHVVSTIDGFVPDRILVNHDMSSGSPAMLKGISQVVMPPVGMGWYRRRKSIHFESYQQILGAFAARFGLPAWRLQADFLNCGKVHFKSMEGLECIANNVDKMISRLKERYATHGIEQEPYVVVKSDSGTYGMGVMMVRSGEEVLSINKKYRHKMHSIKGGRVNDSVIIQEGIATVDAVDGQVAEPMLYLVNGKAIGGAMRVHEQKGAHENLNSVGMRFAPLCPERKGADCYSAEFLCLSVVSQLAALAAVREYQLMEDEADEDEAA